MILKGKEKSIGVSFRLKESTVRQLKDLAKRRGITQTDIIEQLIAYCYEKDLKKK